MTEKYDLGIGSLVAVGNGMYQQDLGDGGVRIIPASEVERITEEQKKGRQQGVGIADLADKANTYCSRIGCGRTTVLQLLPESVQRDDQGKPEAQYQCGGCGGVGTYAITEEAFRRFTDSKKSIDDQVSKSQEWTGNEISVLI